MISRIFLALITVLLVFLGQHYSSTPNVYSGCNILTFLGGAFFLITVFSSFFAYKRFSLFSKVYTVTNAMADRILLSGTLLILTIYSRACIIPVIILIIRDLFSLFLALSLHGKKFPLASSLLFKLQTIIQIIGTALIIFIYGNSNNSNLLPNFTLEFWASQSALLIAMSLTAISIALFCRHRQSLLNNQEKI